MPGIQDLSRRCLFGAIAAGAVVLTSSSSFAQGPAGWPSKPILLVVPMPPGGTSDTAARLVGSEITRILGQPVIVENRAGANGNIGLQAVVRAPADGYTIALTGVGSNSINPALYAKMPFDAQKSFAHISQLVSGPNVLVVRPDFPATTLAELVALARASPGKYNYASSGNGSSNHVTMEMLKQAAGIQLDHVPYKGGSPAITDVMGGQVPMMFLNQDNVLPFVKSGKLRALAVSSPERNPSFPDVPTVAEQGFPGFQATSWVGLSAPAGTPKEIVAKLHDATVKALQVPAVKDRFESTGFIVSGSTPEAYTAFIAAEIDKWTKVAKAANVTID